MKFVKSLIAVAALSTVAMSASAAVNYQGAGQPYVGAKIGQFDIDGVGKKPTAYGVYAGYNFGNGFGAEVDYIGADTVNFDIAGINVEAKSKMYGVHGTYAYHLDNTPFYLKGKLGASKLEVDVKGSTATQTFSDSGSDFGLSYGVGAGYSPSQNLGIEAQYTRPTNSDSLWTVGATLKF